MPDTDTQPEGEYRIERDTLGEVRVPARALWGAQTQRSVENFRIGQERFGRDFIYALGVVKKAAALANGDLGVLDPTLSSAVAKAAERVIQGALDSEFRCSVWQTGSGTQTNMNANEVIANKAMALHKDAGLEPIRVHPNDHVNRGQSSNDVFPTAMHISAVHVMHSRLLPQLDAFLACVQAKAQEFKDVIKVGRTHLMDATPVTLGQEFSAYKTQLQQARHTLVRAMEDLLPIALGGTAVGTGLNAHPEFGVRAARHIATITGMGFVSAENKFERLAAHEPLLNISAALRSLACAFNKMLTDIKWMASGPRVGLGEITLPANEPGSSIMPGKVNPTQCEAAGMVCAQVVGNDTAVTLGAMGGNFELNVYKPLIVRNVLHSAHLLADALENFEQKALAGLKANTKALAHGVERSLMLITALNPVLGYDKAAKIARHAYLNNTSLKEACVGLGFLSAKEFEQHVKPQNMLGPQVLPAKQPKK